MPDTEADNHPQESRPRRFAKCGRCWLRGEQALAAFVGEIWQNAVAQLQSRRQLRSRDHDSVPRFVHALLPHHFRYAGADAGLPERVLQVAWPFPVSAAERHQAAGIVKPGGGMASVFCRRFRRWVGIPTVGGTEDCQSGDWRSQASAARSRRWAETEAAGFTGPLTEPVRSR